MTKPIQAGSNYRTWPQSKRSHICPLSWGKQSPIYLSQHFPDINMVSCTVVTCCIILGVENELKLETSLSWVSTETEWQGIQPWVSRRSWGLATLVTPTQQALPPHQPHPAYPWQNMTKIGSQLAPGPTLATCWVTQFSKDWSSEICASRCDRQTLSRRVTAAKNAPVAAFSSSACMWHLL